MAEIRHILMIVVDDLRPELNCFGKRKLHTPNIDRLAARSTRYERAYCQFPQCMPSRASVMTGIRPTEFCNWSNQLCRQGEPTLAGYLREQGMRTVSAGKVYHEPLDDAFSWNELHMDTFRPKPNGSMTQWFHDYQLEENQHKTVQKFRLTFPEIRQLWEPLPPLSECVDAPDEGYIDHVVAGRAIDCLERHQQDKRGLFLSVGFYRPHLPWTAPKKYWDTYDRNDVDLADNPFLPENGVGMSDLCDFLHYGDQEVQETYSDIGRYRDDDFPVLSEAKQRECVHAYWAAVSFMDAQVGRVLDAVDYLGMADDTAIIFWGDNGWHLGEHKLWSKVTNFDESTRVPLMLSVPGQTHGERHSGLVELVDIYPTCCQLIGGNLPAHLHGAPLPVGHAPGKSHVYAANWDAHTVLSDSLRLTRYRHDAKRAHLIPGRGQVELFDHQTDPRENCNVAADPNHADALARLNDRLCSVYG